MERIAVKGQDGTVRLYDKQINKIFDFGTNPPILVYALNLLCLYEDTGRTPEEIIDLLAEKSIFNIAGKELGIDPNRLRAIVYAEKEGRLVVLPCKVGDAVDKLFSHNEIIALHIEYPEYYQRLWRGEAWRLPEQYKDHELVRFAGFVSENVSESDTINLVIRPNQEAEAALEQRKESKNGK